MVTLQQLIFKLSEFWTSRGCLLQQPLDIEMGAGTMHPETFLRVLGPKPWSVAYVQPSRRPADGRFGENPNRLFKHQQFQVILKPAPGRSAAALSAEPGSLRHRPACARRALRRGQLGVADARRMGHRLAGALRRPGDHAVHLLPAGRRRRPVADFRGAHLRHRAIRDGAAGRRRRVRPRVGARGEVPRRPASRRSGAVEVRVRADRHAGSRAARACTARCSTSTTSSPKRWCGPTCCCRRSITA